MKVMCILRSYFRIALRNIKKNKIQNLFSIIGMSVGFVFFVISLYWLHYESSYDAHIKDSERICQLIYKSTGSTQYIRNKFQYQLLQDIYQDIPEIQQYCFAKPNTHYYVSPEKSGNDEVIVNILEVDKRFFSLMDIHFIEGYKPEVFDSFTYKVVVTESLAKKLFGHVNVLLKKIKNNDDGLNYEIIGVIKDNPANSTVNFEALVPMNKNMRSGDFYSYILLDKKGNREKVVAKLNKEAEKRETDFLDLVPLQQVKYRSTGESFWRAYSPLIAVVVSSFLLLICTFVNLQIVTLSTFIQRIRECAFHRQMGAGSMHIYLLFYLEIGVLLLFSFIICFLLTEALVKPFYGIVHIDLNTQEFCQFAGKWIALFFVFVLLAQLLSIRYVNNKSNLKGAFTGGLVKNVNKRILFFQLIISAIFIFILSVISFQYRYIIHKPLGLPTDNIVFLDLRFDQILKANSDALMNEIEAGSMIHDVTVQSLILFDNKERTLSSNDLSNLTGINKNVTIVDATVTQESAKFFKFQLISGRFAQYIQKPVEVMLNEEAVKQLGLVDPIGKTYEFYGRSYIIVGIIKDYISKPLASPLAPIIYKLYTPLDGYMHYAAYVKYDEAKREMAFQYIEKVCKHYSPDCDMEKVFKPMDLYIRSFYKKELIVLRILTFITVACLMITLWGILGVVSFTLRQQRKSIAIRKIMGASHSLLLKMYLKQYALLAAIACTIGILIAYPFVKRWLEVYAFRIHLGIPIFLIVYGIILVVVLLIAWILVTRALNDNPADVVKENN